MVNLSEHGCIGTKVISYNNNVFVLMMYFSNEKCLSRMVTTESPIAGRSVIDIGVSVTKRKEVVKQRPAAHALTGSYTGSYIYGIGKVTALTVLKRGMALS